jgi:enoyl-CoA hydratase
MTEEILLERPAPHVALVRIQRPEKRNALSVPLRKQLVALLEQLDEEPETLAIVLAGGEKVFAAGADLTEILDTHVIDMVLRANERLWSAISRLRKPLIASVRGLAFGGGFELALHADMIVAGESARFGLPEIKVGLMPGAGGTQRLLRLVGRYKTLFMCLTGDAISAHEAMDRDIVAAVVPDDQVDAQAIALAVRLAAMPPLAVRQIREVVTAGADASLETAMMLERKACAVLCASADKQEGIRALLEKRAPVFTGR